MTIYTAKFRTDADYATKRFDAETPAQALTQARAYYDEHDEELLFQEYDGASAVSEIAITDPAGKEVAVWRDNERRLRLAADDMLDALEAQTDAAQAVVDAWERGDLAGAVRSLDASIAEARAAIAKAKPPGN